jgi:hypothetical protein
MTPGATPSRSVVIHAHFYQPPREEPWLELVEREETAAPFHDWNRRIERECYRAVVAARLPAPDGRIARVMNNAEHLMVAIEQDRPLLGKPLNNVLAWQRPTTGPGCYCEPSARKHKWGLVLETIHHALVQREGS